MIKINLKIQIMKFLVLVIEIHKAYIIDKDNNIFSTEHGPTYGDELNYISQNNNYGWPLATYGTNYKSADAYAKKKVR